jgi:undecaprenyl-diphosphatase
MNYLDATILGVVEGLTEFLPISSTGHMLIIARLLNIPSGDPLFKSFVIAIQPGAILAVVVLYWRTLLVNWAVLSRVLLACVPTAVLGLLLYSVVKRLLDKEALDVVVWSLGLGGLGLILFEMFHGERRDAVEGLTNIRYWQAGLIGVFQAFAFVPGVSRAAATVVGGMVLGVRRKTMVEFSFLLAVPTMVGAAGYDLYKVYKGEDGTEQLAFTGEQIAILLVGFVVSFVVALVAIRVLVRFIQTHSFVAFGVYRIVAANVFWYLLFGR